MPLYRRVARRGFSNYPFKKEYVAVSLSMLDEAFEEGATVTSDALRDALVIKGVGSEAKILANGEIKKRLVIDGVKISGSAAEKIKAAGGEVK
jgi:large subunit ribosomal protein L15